MANVRLKEFRVEPIEEGGPSFAIFDLSKSPSPSWIVHFEECLAKHSGVAVVVSDRRVRTELPPLSELGRLLQIVQRCIEETNVQDAC
jgi:hypothetical protein